MKKLKLTCHACRNECEIEVTYEDGEVLETSMDNIELSIARDYLRKNLRFMREEYA